MNPKPLLQFFYILFLGTCLVFQQACKTEDDTKYVLSEQEKEILETGNSFLPNELVQSLEKEMVERSGNSDYDIYLDTLYNSLNILKTAIASTFSLEEFRQACVDFQSNISNLKNSNNLECELRELGLGYGKGASIELGPSGTLGLGIAASLEAQGGGGVEVIYDFVNMERQIYTFSLCSMGWEIGPGIGAGLHLNLGFTGFYDWFLGNQYGNLSENKYAGPSRSINWGLDFSLKTALGLDVGISFGTTKDLLVPCDGILNTQECVWYNPMESDELKGISFAYELGGSVGVGLELITAVQSEYVGYCHQGFEGTYTDFQQTLYGRQVASYKMAAELLSGGISSGIIVPSALAVDLVSAAAAVIYGSFNLDNCDSGEVPSVITDDIINITNYTATSGGNVTAPGSSDVTSRGVCYGTDQNPTLDGYGTLDGNGVGPFTSSITGLSPGTVYYVRAYATNLAGTAYGIQKQFTTQAESCPGYPTVVYDGQEYNTVQIGSQCWLKENLNVGNRINGNQEQDDNDIIEKYCPNDSESDCDIYGGLYQWNEMMQYVTTEGIKGICPDGWHIPTDGEWQVLIDYLGGQEVAGGKLKEDGTDHWQSPNTGATNSSGFTAISGGIRYPNGETKYFSEEEMYWSSSQDSYITNNALVRGVSYHSIKVYDSPADQYHGFPKMIGASVRCLKDN